MASTYLTWGFENEINIYLIWLKKLLLLLQYGFARSKTTGNVDTSKVYNNGRYWLGPDTTFKVFESIGQNISLPDTTVFAAPDKIEVRDWTFNLTCHRCHFHQQFYSQVQMFRIFPFAGQWSKQISVVIVGLFLTDVGRYSVLLYQEIIAIY